MRIWKIDKKTKKFSLIQTLEDHTGRLKAVALTVNSKLLVSAAEDFTVRLWLRKKGNSGLYTPLQVLRGHKNNVLGVDVTRDGSLIASASTDKTVRIWRRDHNSVEFAQNQVLEGHERTVYSVKISDDGNTILSGASDRTVRVWKLDTHAYHIVGVFKLDHGAHQVILMDNHFLVTHILAGSSIGLISPPMKHFFSSFLQDYRISATMYKALSEFDTKGVMRVLLDQLPRNEKAQEEKKAEDIIRLHTEINPLFWFCLFESPLNLRKALRIWHYEDWVYGQCKQFDPFEYSFELGSQDLINVWVEYFQEYPERLRVNSLESFNKLLSCKNSLMQSFGISKLKIDSALATGIDPIVVYPIIKNRGFVAVKSNQVMMSEKIQDEFNQMKDNSKPGVKVNGKSACIGLSPDLSRLLIFLDRVEGLTPENKMTLRPVVMTIFEMYRPVFLVYSGLNLIAKVLLFAIVIFQKKQWYCTVPFYLIYSIMLIYELIDVVNKGWVYFTNLFNWFDILLYPCSMALVTYILAEGHDFMDNQFNNFLVFALLYIALTRAVSMLRVLDSTRYLIYMILMVYKDMTPFMVVLSFYIVGTGSLNILLSFTNNDEGQPKYGLTLKQLRLSSDVIYNWGYGNWEGTPEMNALNFWFYIHTGIFIGLVMFNLLIAIISATYEQFTEDKMRVDLNEVVSLLQEMGEFLKFWRRIREMLFGVTESEKIFLHFLIPSEEDDGEIEQLAEELEELKGKVEEGHEQMAKMAEEVRSVKRDMKQNQMNIERSQKEIKEQIGKIFELVSKQSGQTNTADKGKK